jgi:hypothetical protein
MRLVPFQQVPIEDKNKPNSQQLVRTNERARKRNAKNVKLRFEINEFQQNESERSEPIRNHG